MHRILSNRQIGVRAGLQVLLFFFLGGVSGCASSWNKGLYEGLGAAMPAATVADARSPAAAEGAGEADNSVLTSFAAGTAEEASGDPTGDAAAPTKKIKRLMIYTGRFDLLVPTVKDAVTRFLKKIEEVGGYLQLLEDSRVICRVPASQFQEVVAMLPELGVLTSETIRALDVTKQYHDLRLRIENAEKARDRLLALLEKAQKVEDMLKIEGELRRLTEEIERLKGEFKYLSDQIAFSTVEVNFLANAPEPRPIRGRTHSRFGWINRVGVEHVLERF